MSVNFNASCNKGNLIINKSHIGKCAFLTAESKYTGLAEIRDVEQDKISVRWISEKVQGDMRHISSDMYESDSIFNASDIDCVTVYDMDKSYMQYRRQQSRDAAAKSMEFSDTDKTTAMLADRINQANSILPDGIDRGSSPEYN